MVRDKQIELSVMMFESMRHKKVALCEAEVGTGKTLAYLEAAIVYGLYEGKERRTSPYVFAGQMSSTPITITTSSIDLQVEIKRKKGDFIGSFAVYGCLKAPGDRHKLMVDEYASTVVQDIFKWKLQGISQQRIANSLNEMGILSPLEYKRSCGMNYISGFQTNLQGKWTAVSVGRILRNEFYIGTLVQGKRSTPKHKIRTQVLKPQEDWIRIENSHEAIIAPEDLEDM